MYMLGTRSAAVSLSGDPGAFHSSQEGIQYGCDGFKPNYKSFEVTFLFIIQKKIYKYFIFYRVSSVALFSG